MKAPLNLISVSIFFLFLSGMSSRSGRNPETIPLPEKNFTATLLTYPIWLRNAEMSALKAGHTFQEKEERDFFEFPLKILRQLLFFIQKEH